MESKKIAKFLLKLSVSAAFVAWLVFRIDWPEVIVYAKRISILQMIVYVAVLLAGMLISAYKWKVLSEFKGFRLSWIRSFQLYLAGTFINNFMPSFIGGDTYRAYQIGKEEKKYVSAAATVVMDRITGLLGAMALSVIFAASNWRAVAGHRVLVIILLVVALCLAAAAGMEMIFALPVWKKISRFVPEKITELVKDFAEYQGSSALYKSLALSVAFSLVGLAAVNYVLFWALGIHVGIMDYLTVIFLISIVSALPVSVNNIGIKEWAYVTFFGFFGVASSAVVAIALVSRVIQMIVSFAALPEYLRGRDKTD